MVIFGNPSEWDGFFPSGLRDEILNLIIDSWDHFEKINDIENRITSGFCCVLEDEKDKRDLPFRIINEHVLNKKKIRIDINFLYGSKNNVYFAFECKRLRVISKKGKIAGSKDANAYIGPQGMKCFIDGRYIGAHGSGGMIGYVMDGNVNEAIDDVRKAIKKNSSALKVVTNTSLEPSTSQPDIDFLKESYHLGEKQLLMYHIFLPIV